MKNIEKILACFLTATLVFSNCVFAKDNFTANEVSFKNGLIFTDGTTPEANMKVAVSVVRKGDSKGEINKLCYIDEILSDKNSKYELSFNLKDAPQVGTLTGEYVLYIKCDSENIIERTFKYSDYTSVLNSIISADTYDDIYNLLETLEERDSFKALGFDMNLYNLLENDKKKALCKLLFDSKTMEDSAQSVSEKFAVSLGVTLITTKVRENILSGLKLINPVAEEIAFNDITDDIYKNFAADCMALESNTADLNSAVKSYKKADALYKINTASVGSVYECIRNSADLLEIKSDERYVKWLNLSENEIISVSRNLVSLLDKNKAKSVSLLLNAMAEAGTFNSNERGSGGGSSSGSTGGGYNLSGVESVSDQNEKFTDLNTALWAKDAILKLSEKNVVSGYGDNTFLPNNLIRREEFTKIIVTAFDIKDGGRDISFSDVNQNDWYYPFIKKAYGADIVKGISKGEFGVSSYVTRQDMAVMLSRILEKHSKNFKNKKDYNTFADEDKISDYALESVKILYKLGVINGYEDNTFKPFGNATRAEAAYIINSIFEIIESN